jgi:hypothetical protein
MSGKWYASTEFTFVSFVFIYANKLNSRLVLTLDMGFTCVSVTHIETQLAWASHEVQQCHCK